MQAPLASEALWWALLDVSDVIVGEPPRDASERQCVIEELTRKREATCGVDVQLDFLHAGRIPL